MGATTFWEDFDLEWIKKCNSIDRLPLDDEKDIHGDFGRYCYKNFRHSLCHGWSAGVVAFVIEKMIGLQVFDGWKRITVSPDTDLEWIRANLATPYGELTILAQNGEVQVEAPEQIQVTKGENKCT